MKKKKKEPFMISFETFRNIGDYIIGTLKKDSPACFNGMVLVNKYRVTIEPIEEPVEVVAARLQELWDNSINHHDYVPLQNKADAIGYALKGIQGNKRKKNP